MDWSSRIYTPPFETARRDLLEAVEAFKRWAVDWKLELLPDKPSGEWETSYLHWPALNTAVIKLLQASPPDRWDPPVVQALLYALARDNEEGWLKNDLLDSPTHLIALAHAGVSYDDPDAKWQLADALGSPHVSDDQAEPLLDRFVHDDDEYVSRIALLALGARRSPKAEQLAVRAWTTGHEHQRIVALSVLFDICSPLLPAYLGLSRLSSQEYVRARALEIEGWLQERQNPCPPTE